jgi:uncharacterized membrane protein
VLDRLHLNDKLALLFIALIIGLGFVPDIRITKNFAFNLGGAVIPLGVCAWLIAKADTLCEKRRALLGAAVTAAAVWALSAFLPDEPEAMFMDPNLLYGLAAGAVAYVLGRSRRGAFFAGVTGVLLADAAVAVINWWKGIDQQLVLGGAGIADAAVMAGVFGVLLAELVGETAERIACARRKG